MHYCTTANLWGWVEFKVFTPLHVYIMEHGIKLMTNWSRRLKRWSYADTFSPRVRQFTFCSCILQSILNNLLVLRIYCTVPNQYTQMLALADIPTIYSYSHIWNEPDLVINKSYIQYNTQTVLFEARWPVAFKLTSIECIRDNNGSYTLRTLVWMHIYIVLWLWGGWSHTLPYFSCTMARNHDAVWSLILGLCTGNPNP